MSNEQINSTMKIKIVESKEIKCNDFLRDSGAINAFPYQYLLPEELYYKIFFTGEVQTKYSNQQGLASSVQSLKNTQFL